jgi:hypothetical protein
MNAATNILVIIQPDGTETRETYTGEEPELEKLQKAVGGFIELVRVDFEGARRDAFVNEEGRLEGLPMKVRACEITGPYGYGVIVGPIAILVPAVKP